MRNKADTHPLRPNLQSQNRERRERTAVDVRDCRQRIFDGLDSRRLESSDQPAPLAAWGSWQRVLRADPDSRAAQQALATLESAADLPLAARTSYRFRQPFDPARRSAWDARMRDQGDHELEATADVFGRLAAEDPTDSAAWYNRALCLAWMGKNFEAIGCLDRVVGLEAERAFDLAVDAWTLAEMLRQGGGAETLADDLRFACTIAWNPGDTSWLLEEFPEIQRIPTPRAPGATAEEHSEIEVFEWLDRPVSQPLCRSPATGLPPTVLASVYINGQTLRLSSPRVETLERIEEPLFPGSRTAAAPSGVKRRRCLSLFSTPMFGFFGSHPILSPIEPTSSGASRSSGTLRTSGSTARATDLTAARRWQPRLRRIAVIRSHAPS